GALWLRASGARGGTQAAASAPAPAPAPAGSAPGGAGAPPAEARADEVAADLMRDGEQKLRQGDLPGARYAYEQALRLMPGDARAAAGLGTVELEARNYAGAVHYLREALAIAPRSADYHLLMCQARF